MSQGSYQYHNCYAMLEEIRTDLNEFNDALCQGSEVGVFDNTDIVRKINKAQKFIFNLLFTRMPDLFLTSSSVLGSSGVYAIPTDMYRLSQIVNSNGDKIYPITVKTKHLSSSTGSDNLYYRSGNTIVRDSVNSDALTFHYWKSPKELTQGMSSAGSSGALTLATTAKTIADYYNNITIENITDGWSSIISDYTAARVATITGTGAASKYYGTVSELPDIFHPLISQRATISMKNTTVSPQRSEKSEVDDFRESLIETLRSFTGSQSDVSMDELFYDFNQFV